MCLLRRCRHAKPAVIANKQTRRGLQFKAKNHLSIPAAQNMRTIDATKQSGECPRNSRSGEKQRMGDRVPLGLL